MKKAKAQTPGPSSSVEDWHRYFRHRFPPEKLSGSRAIETLYNTVYGGLAPSGSAWPPALKELYELHTLLFAMRLLDELSGAGYRYAYGYDYYTMQEALSLTFDQIYNRLVHVIRSMEPAEAWRLYPERLQETIAYLAVHAFPASSSFVPWMPVYISLWRGLLETEAAAEREIARLSRAVRQEGVSSGQHDQLLTARIMFDIDAGEDEAGLSRLQQFKLRGHGRIYPFLYAFQHAAQWARLQLWLERMAPIFVSQWGQPDRTYYEFWKTLLDKHPDMGKLREAWEKTMLELLPNSFPYYLDQLMAQERFREWVDLHMAFGYTPLELRVSDYKPIEQKQKHLLLPWFHHSVEKLIAEKNRVAYKQAVKLMKKLRTMYGKLKRIDRWELYLEHVSVKYSRLRALQEELKVLRKEGA
ncbi:MULTISPECIES: hypothetical protein [unclassified Paenibacillus]|uniref:hypothetical protein n=1 Tax=unclassified Paenibacillus TaxID=185978 RepID=UPI0011600926|nr:MULTISPECIES: hypothetical protein [unclassified Paenibacillus]